MPFNRYDFAAANSTGCGYEIINTIRMSRLRDWGVQRIFRSRHGYEKTHSYLYRDITGRPFCLFLTVDGAISHLYTYF